MRRSSFKNTYIWVSMIMPNGGDDTVRSQSDPSIRRPHLAGELRIRRIAMTDVQQPAIVLLSTLDHHRDRLVAPFIQSRPCQPQIIQTTQHVVVPQRRKREETPRRLDDLTRRQPPHQASLQQILLAPAPRINDAVLAPNADS